MTKFEKMLNDKIKDYNKESIHYYQFAYNNITYTVEEYTGIQGRGDNFIKLYKNNKLVYSTYGSELIIDEIFGI